MPFPLIPLIIAGASAAGGALSNTKGARTSTSTPTIAPEYKTLADLLRTRAEDRLRSTMDMSGYTGTGLSNINDAFAGLKQSSENNLTSRGLASSPVAATVGQNLDMARGGNIIEFLNSIPLLQRQMENQDLAMGQNVLQSGIGNTGVGPGSAIGGAFDNAAGMLGYLYRLRQLQGST